MKSDVLDCTYPEAKHAIDMFLAGMPGLQEIRRKIKAWAKQGYFEGIDGRMVLYDREHGMLSGILQNAEKVIMARGVALWYPELVRLGIPFKFVNFVHDEWQTEVQGGQSMAEFVGVQQSGVFDDVGRSLGFRCPLVGNFKLGKTWAETH